VMHCLFRDGKADRDFLAKHTDVPDELEQHLRSRDRNGPRKSQVVRSKPLRSSPDWWEIRRGHISGLVTASRVPATERPTCTLQAASLRSAARGVMKAAAPSITTAHLSLGSQPDRRHRLDRSIDPHAGPVTDRRDSLW
jgi:anaerobic selenocysteine-containing dehydrogenase